METEDMEIEDLSKDEEDYETEERLIYIEIDPNLLSQNQIKEADCMKIYGIDTKRPLLRINNHYFEGEFDLSIGTHTFFEKDPNAPVDELYCKSNCYYKFSDKTNKVLKMSRVLVQDKATTSQLNEKMDADIRNQLEVKRTYQQALDLFLSTRSKPPRKISQELNGESLIKKKQSKNNKT